ncbi:hypothetical protein AR158_c139R [Paramecium bursaria Chlorella virus AR158]|uniref:hypothetical protein n=1 Tax=Paramecium bursaria Chlorella virus AR158 TaxID=380598 RepID=UPI00015AA7EA|nr:hypothetical protein AR158_c139R [Paramecium bursaria Chlorella virus AR158]ABU43685.1 hypothetical protein AR158_c139R [Paramecium bursaria Chlorella virus AR158]
MCDRRSIDDYVSCSVSKHSESAFSRNYFRWRTMYRPFREEIRVRSFRCSHREWNHSQSYGSGEQNVRDEEITERFQERFGGSHTSSV